MILHADNRLRKIRRILLVISALLVAPESATAQRVTGPSEDATVLPRGVARVTISPTWFRYHERFADGLGRRRKGEAEPLAADFDVDSLLPSMFPGLTQVESELRAILGSTVPLPITAGRLQTRFDANVAFTPITGEFGVTSRLTLGVMVPLVKTRTEVSVNPNPGGVGATVGLNPALTNPQARTINAAVVTQLMAAAAQLQQRLQDCAGSADPTCAAINANRQAAQDLVASAGAAATGIENVYGVSTARPGSVFAPVHQSSVQRNVESRPAAFSAGFTTFLGAAPGTGWITDQPVGAPPMGYADFTRLLTDPDLGIVSDTLQSVELNTVGDVEVGAKFLLYDSFGTVPPQQAPLGGVRFRVSLGALYRFGSGLIESPTHFADIGTGDAQNDIEGRVYADALFGRRFWASFVGRYGVQQANAQVFRVPDAPHQPVAPASRQLPVWRDLGDYMAAEFSPRLVVTENIAFSGTYSFYSKGADDYSLGAGAVVDPDSVAAIDPAVLGLGTERKEQRVLAAVTYSNLASYYRGRARIPMEVSFSFGRTIAGEGNAPRASVSALTFRFYNRVFGK